ncbi:MAG: N-6 DNA methylase [Planctomycetaceae bacterium]|jgi:type I restriction-modification system DNA methylase subunit|nr:N-6 DNA methylase [Planctomycetaceae bacterium]
MFQYVILQKYIKPQSEKIHSAFERYALFFRNPEQQTYLRQCKEEQFQEGFLRELFVNILEYKLFPDPNHNLVTEKNSVTNSKKADAVIQIDQEVRVVIELKDTRTTDLKRVESQAFDYKFHHKNATYVVVSNFEKLRFYIDNAVEHLEWNLFTLTEEQFAVLWLCLAYENIEADLPKQLKAESLGNEDKITKEYYVLYKQFKDSLFNDLVTNNPNIDRLSLFLYAQKIVDRFVFILMAEDRGLLEANLVKNVLAEWQYFIDLDEDRRLYDYWKKYFVYIDTGSKSKKHKIFGYNGGLFKPDPELDRLIISDTVLLNRLQYLSNYTYRGEVDVNILGHIFEHSLAEIGKKKIELAGINSFELPHKLPHKLPHEKPHENKRKKDGIFYTPTYITAFIIENTLGKICNEKKTELGLDQPLTLQDVSNEVMERSPLGLVKGKKKNKNEPKNPLLEHLDEYRNWLFSLRICDPACGSGAFLNAAYDFLLREHRVIDETESKIQGIPLDPLEVEHDILTKNLYGVDINEESIEITKLALWLHTAKPFHRLNFLDNNIQCGNSLISDPKIDPEKAFDWHKEFPHVFKNGGFDIVVGNPPYVRFEHIPKVSETLEKVNYQTYHKRGDIHCVFVERGFQLLKPSGFISYIMPNKWMQTDYGKSLREFLLTTELVRVIDIGENKVFEDAGVTVCIFVVKKSSPQKDFIATELKPNVNFDKFSECVKQREEIFPTNKFSSNAWIISSQREKHLQECLQKKYKTLNDFVGGQAFYGIKTGFTEAFLIDEVTKNKIVHDDPNAEKRIKLFLRGRDIKRYTNKTVCHYLIFFEKGITLQNNKNCNEINGWKWLSKSYPSIAKWLEPYAEKCKTRTDYGDFWWELRACDYYVQFSEPKIMYQSFQRKSCFIYDETGLFCNNSMWIIPTGNKALLAVLNSKLAWWLITLYCSNLEGMYQLIWNYFGRIPIPPKLPAGLSTLADKMILLNTNIHTRRHEFLRRLTDNFDNIKITELLEHFDRLTFKEFLGELTKQKISLILESLVEWETFFRKYQTQCRNLTRKITETDQEIDRLVYKLYGLTHDEIKMIDNN